MVLPLMSVTMQALGLQHQFRPTVSALLLQAVDSAPQLLQHLQQASVVPQQLPLSLPLDLVRLQLLQLRVSPLPALPPPPPPPPSQLPLQDLALPQALASPLQQTAGEDLEAVLGLKHQQEAAACSHRRVEGLEQMPLALQQEAGLPAGHRTVCFHLKAL